MFVIAMSFHIFYMKNVQILLKPLLIHNKHQLLCKVWPEYKGKPFLGKGGGGAHLTELGEKLPKEYKGVEDYMGKIVGDEEYWKRLD